MINIHIHINQILLFIILLAKMIFILLLFAVLNASIYAQS